ncbi:MAG: hypothetical protein HeimC2_22650 [Candidatus Heimdallarchaeota archaeon LC_2]|nr:MAG: hypothetical protein HeimC2_22650 [Candidatus Heimdallarchaeota archaeon LC_2]
MGQSRPEIIITTTHQPSEQARSFCKVLEHIIPDSTYISRGRKNIDDITAIAIDANADLVYICNSKGGKLSELHFYKIRGSELTKLDHKIKIYDFIDYKIYGWKYLPERGPLSLSNESRNVNPELSNFLEQYFRIVIGDKTPLWLLFDSKNKDAYLQFIDALTLRTFTYLRIRLL